MRNRRQLRVYLLATGVMTVIAMVVGASADNKALAIMAGAMFAVGAVYVGVISVPARSDEQAHPRAAQAAWFAELIATTYAWASTTMLGCYYLTALSWQHAWQYGAAMLLIAAGLLAYARERRAAAASRFNTPAMIGLAHQLTLLHGIAATAAVIILSLSGKLEAGKSDWAANIVFVAGGLAVGALSFAALAADKRATD